MTINGFFTQKGLELSAKLAAGGTLVITRVTAGCGETADTATALSEERQPLAVNTPTHSGSTATIPATLVPAAAAESYSLTELGVYADAPDDGEILYKVYRPDEPVNISPESNGCLRFYLNEAVSAEENAVVSCSPAGLVTEAMFQQVEQAVLTCETPVVSVTLDAGELPAYIRSLPRFLDRTYAITVSGTLTEQLHICNFHGNGFIRIAAPQLGDCVVQGGILVENCSAALQLGFLQIHNAALSGNNSLVKVSSCGSVYMYNCSFSGQHDGVGRCLVADYGSHVSLQECTMSNAFVGALVSYAAVVSINADTTGTFSGINRGAWVWNGGIILIGPNVPELLGGSTNVKQGGMIARADGTLL